MKFVTIRTSDGTRAGRVDGDEVVTLPFADLGALLQSGEGWANSAQANGDRLPLADVDFAPTVTNPSKIFCLGLSYADHIAEIAAKTDFTAQEYPTLFAKFADSLTGPTDSIGIPSYTTEVDWEVELVIVIGKVVRRATDAQALDAIAGYAVGNDVSMRDWQFRTPQWLQGKTWDASTPLGAMVTKDEFANSAFPDLAVSCELDGEVVQNSRTSNLVHEPVSIVSYITSFATLRPGDLIFTGTPGGVGFGRTPAVFIQPGQVLTTRIEGIGECVNSFHAD